MSNDPVDHAQVDALLGLFRDATGVRLRLVPTDGAPFPKDTPSPFCALLHARDRDCAVACANFHKKGWNEARNARRAVCQTCRVGLSHLAVPVIHQNGVYGYIESEPLVANGTPLQQPPVWKSKALTETDCRLQEAFARILRASRARINGLLLLLELLAGRIASTLAESPARFLDRSAADSLVERAETFLRAHSMEEISSIDVARALRVSECHLCRTFRKVTGRSISESLSEIRLAIAQRLLLAHPHATVAQIAFAAGFHSITHFYSVFTSRYGLAPGMWRRRQQAMEASTRN